MREFQGVAISEAPLLAPMLLVTAIVVAILAGLIVVVIRMAKGKMVSGRVPKWVDWVTNAAILMATTTVLILLGIHATRHWLDYVKKDYCVYTGSYTVKEIESSGRSKSVSYVAVLPDGRRIDISMGDVGYTTGTLVYTARTNILLGYDDSMVIKPDK